MTSVYSHVYMPCSWKRNILLSLVATFLGLGISEVALRVFPMPRIPTPDELNANVLDYEAALFSSVTLPRKVQEISHEVHGKKITVRINSRGYRGREFLVPKPSGTRRIVVYGGSSVIDLANTEGKEWTAVAEQKLHAQGFGDLEIINAGIGGTTSADAAGRLFAEGLYLQPDYVILYDTWNDLKRFTADEPLLRQTKPWQRSASPFHAYQSLLDRQLGRSSELYRVARGIGLYARYGEDIEHRVQAVQPAAQSTALARAQYQLNLQTFIDTAKNIGAVPVLMTEARLVTPENSAAQRGRIRYEFVGMDHEALCRAYAEADDIIRAVGAAKQVSVFDASAMFSGRDEYFGDHVHLTEQGADALGKWLAERLVFVIPKQNQVTSSSYASRSPISLGQ